MGFSAREASCQDTSILSGDVIPKWVSARDTKPQLEGKFQRPEQRQKGQKGFCYDEKFETRGLKTVRRLSRRRILQVMDAGLPNCKLWGSRKFLQGQLSNVAMIHS